MAAKSFCSIFIISILIASLIISGDATSADFDVNGWIPVKSAGNCEGSIAECMAGAGEFEMDSESNRRILATTDYISYGALQSNSAPCSRRGASYYNCKPGAEANPYSRGCSEITRCRS